MNLPPFKNDEKDQKKYEQNARRIPELEKEFNCQVRVTSQGCEIYIHGAWHTEKDARYKLNNFKYLSGVSRSVNGESCLVFYNNEKRKFYAECPGAGNANWINGGKYKEIPSDLELLNSIK